MSLETIVNYYKKRDLTADEIERLLHKKVILYSDLKNYKSIYEVLGKENFAVILYQCSSYSNGHYIALSKNDKTGKIRYFCSFGLSPLTELQYTKYDQRLPPYLLQLLNGVDYEVNKIDYQGKYSNVCGRYSILACNLRNISLQQIYILLSTNSGFFKDRDNLVCALTLLPLDDIEKYYNK
jgi:hypothetical protein